MIIKLISSVVNIMLLTFQYTKSNKRNFYRNIDLDCDNFVQYEACIVKPAFLSSFVECIL